MKKLLSLILVVAMLATAMVGCTPKAPSVDEENNLEATDVVVKLPASYNDRLASIEALSGKKDDDNTVVMTIGDYNISLADYEYAYISAYNQILQYVSYGIMSVDDIYSEDRQAQLADAVTLEIKMVPGVLTMAAEKGIDVTDEEYNYSVTETYNGLIEQYGDLDELLSQPLSPTIYSFLKFNLAYALYDKIAATFDNAADTKAKATEVLNKAKAGEDFDALITEYNEDPGMTTNTDGYFFTYGEMVQAFETTSFELNDNEISDLVETEYGYHIIKKLPIDDAFKATETYTNVYNTLSEQYEGEELEAKLGEYVRVKHILLQFTDNYQLCYEAIEASLDNFELTKVENFDELVAPVHKEMDDFLAELKAQFDAMYGGDDTSEETVIEDDTVSVTE